MLLQSAIIRVPLPPDQTLGGWRASVPTGYFRQVFYHNAQALNQTHTHSDICVVYESKVLIYGWARPCGRWCTLNFIYNVIIIILVMIQKPLVD